MLPGSGLLDTAARTVSAFVIRIFLKKKFYCTNKVVGWVWSSSMSLSFSSRGSVVIAVESGPWVRNQSPSRLGSWVTHVGADSWLLYNPRKASGILDMIYHTLSGLTRFQRPTPPGRFSPNVTRIRALRGKSMASYMLAPKTYVCSYTYIPQLSRHRFSSSLLRLLPPPPPSRELNTLPGGTMYMWVFHLDYYY